MKELKINWMYFVLAFAACINNSFACNYSENGLPQINKFPKTEHVVVYKSYEHDGISYQLQIIDSTKLTKSLFNKNFKTVQITKKMKIRSDAWYRLRYGKSEIRIANLKIPKPCNEKYSAKNGWIALSKTGRIIIIPDIENVINIINLNISKNATIKKSPATPDLLCQDSYDSINSDCDTSESNPVIKEILKSKK